MCICVLALHKLPPPLSSAQPHRALFAVLPLQTPLSLGTDASDGKQPRRLDRHQKSTETAHRLHLHLLGGEALPYLRNRFSPYPRDAVPPRWILSTWGLRRTLLRPERP